MRDAFGVGKQRSQSKIPQLLIDGSVRQLGWTHSEPTLPDFEISPSVRGIRVVVNDEMKVIGHDRIRVEVDGESACEQMQARDEPLFPVPVITASISIETT